MLAFKPRRPESGFTLIELLIVIIVLGILAALAYPSYLNMTRRARYAEAKIAMNAIAKELKIYRAEHNRYPAEVASGERPEGVINWPSRVPFDSSYDYDHWAIAAGECYVQVAFYGENQIRDYTTNVEVVPPPALETIDDDLVLAVERYACDEAPAGGSSGGSSGGGSSGGGSSGGGEGGEED
ncbi:type IV pilin protein [Halomicronema hongdechloris]|nr:prepilin-type N-terminal cleavage/methylation domain-containing protein [Halomicronema hongdechloris]